jgi:5-methyltetrahydropteroyltriglutamate--homocysteine methyltransferase
MRFPLHPMERSERRILTTHAGSLPRPKALLDLMVRVSRREPVDEAVLADAVRGATEHVVASQLEVGIDVGNDGEQARESFVTHVQHRLSGFGGTSERPVMRDIVHYPSFLELKLPDFSGTMVSLMNAPKAVGAVRHADRGPLERECAGYRAVLDRHEPGFVESFMTAPSPGIVASVLMNEHYPSLEEYVAAVADALRPEYEYIVAQGFVLQIDAPDLAMERHTAFADRPLDDFLRFVDVAIAALDRALADVPRERVRLHVCWGNYEGPHIFDVPLAEVLPHLYAARVGALVLSMANPRHAHEHRELRRLPLPKGVLLVAGVIDPTTNYVEHPEVVAERLELAVNAVGDPRRVIAGTDCGFGTAAGLGEVAEEIVWEKLRALRTGADLATRRLL